MRFTQLVTKTTKDVASDEVSRNAQLLTRGGFIHRLMAGAYTYLPLGMRVLAKIENIVCEEMNAIGASEILMPALQPREIWDKTNRWDSMDVLFRLKGAGDRDLALGPTHEEVVTPLMIPYIQSYRDLPKAVYQIQTKFRNEARAKSGLLRGREFRMKDMYSFHATQADLDAFYEKTTVAYHNIFRRCGLGDITLLTYASGGAFSKFSHEFQAVSPHGEDTIYKIPGTNFAINKEIVDDPEALAAAVPGYKPGDKPQFEEVRAIEVGNIFKLGTRFSEACDLHYADAEGNQQSPIMGCYGIGPSRVMGTVGECLSDDKGLIWSPEIAPYDVHLVALTKTPEEKQQADELYESLKKSGMDVLYDDRDQIRAGEKFADADLMGIPVRLVISSNTIAAGGVEYKRRDADKAETVTRDALFQTLKAA